FSTGSDITYGIANGTSLAQDPFLNATTLGHPPYTFGQFFAGNGFTAPASVLVPAHGTATVHVSIAEPGWDDHAFYGGHIFFTPASGPQLVVPYAGFVGDYQTIDPIQSGNCSLPTLAHFGA